MFQLNESDFKRIKPLMKKGIEYPEVLSIAEGNNPGQIYADDKTHPRTALV